MATPKKANIEIKYYGINDVSKKYGISRRRAVELINEGGLYELEHTDSIGPANKIAATHIYLDGLDYYDKKKGLPAMEKKLKAGTKKMGQGGTVEGEQENIYSETIYRVLIDHDNNTKEVLKTTDRDEAQRKYDSIDSMDFDNPNSNYNSAFIEKFTNKYKFVYKLDPEYGEEIDDYKDSGFLSNPEYWELIDEGEWENVESKKVIAANEETDEMINELTAHYGTYAGYKIIHLDEDGNVTVNLRIKDHSGLRKNRGGADYMLSIVIANINATKQFYTQGPEGFSRDEEFVFDSDSSVQDIIAFIDEKLEEFKQDAIEKGLIKPESEDEDIEPMVGELNKQLIRVVTIRDEQVQIYTVDANYVRANLHPDWNSGGHHKGWNTGMEFIPMGEIWIDQSADETAREGFIIHEVFEYALMLYDNIDYEAAHEKANKVEQDYLMFVTKYGYNPLELSKKWLNGIYEITGGFDLYVGKEKIGTSGKPMTYLEFTEELLKTVQPKPEDVSYGIVAAHEIANTKEQEYLKPQTFETSDLEDIKLKELFDRWMYTGKIPEEVFFLPKEQQKIIMQMSENHSKEQNEEQQKSMDLFYVSRYAQYSTPVLREKVQKAQKELDSIREVTGYSTDLMNTIKGMERALEIREIEEKNRIKDQSLKSGHRVFTISDNQSKKFDHWGLSEDDAVMLFLQYRNDPEINIVDWSHETMLPSGYSDASKHISHAMGTRQDNGIADPIGMFTELARKRLNSENSAKKQEIPSSPQTPKKMKQQDSINSEIRKLLSEKGMNRSRYSKEDFMLLSTYSGHSKTEEEVQDGYFYDFYTPDEVVKVCWQLAYKYGFKASESAKILEPSCGVGRFLRYAPVYSKVKAFDIDETSCAIAKLLYPKFNIINDTFESEFFYKTGLNKYDYKATIETYNLVIGNPPYKQPYDTPYFSKKELMTYPFIKSLEQWFMIRGADCLEKNGLLIYVIPSKIIDNNSSAIDFKAALMEKVNMIDAYRLPMRTFADTDINTDIVVLQKK